MKKVLLSITMMSALVLASCGGDASADATGEANADATKTEEGAGDDAATNDASTDGAMDLCDCLTKASEYPGEDEARAALGDEVIDHCMGLLKNASDEEIMGCAGMEMPEVEDAVNEAQKELD